MSPAFALRLVRLWMLAALLAALSAPAMAALRLSDTRPDVAVWPELRLLHDPGGRLDAATALQRLPDFRPPDGPDGNLGVQREPVWLAMALEVADGDGTWWFDLDYPPFNEARIFLLEGDRKVQELTVGSVLPYEARPTRARTHVAALALQAGHRYQLLVRLRSDSAMVLPLRLLKPAAYMEREAARELGLGLMFGLAAALLAYALIHGLSLRNPLFALYALMLLGSSLFFLDYSGIGQQFLWSERRGMTAMISPLSVLLAMAAGGPFVMRSLDTRTHSPWLHRGLVLLSALAAVLLGLGLVGALNYRQGQTLATLIGPLVPLLAIPAAWRRARRGERVAVYMLLGWGCYVVGALSMASLLRGLLPANFWTLHLYQWASLLEMLAWLRVLGLHVEAVRQEARQQAAVARDLSVLAHTDGLTGLPNRRGLDLALEAALQRCDEVPVAVFMVDLDGFKAVNDRLGHAVGDRLLIEVARRLQATLRRNDRVARLGGDEFVLIAEGAGEPEARRIGAKLLEAFSRPLLVDGQPCQVGLTLGYCLAPQDGRLAAELVRLADAAMYAAKRAGRHRMQRAEPGLPKAA